PGRSGDPGLFGPRSLAWRVNRETVLLLGGGRALLMQVAHPLVAAGGADPSGFTAKPFDRPSRDIHPRRAGVADHSDFTANPFDRLWRTIDAALTVIFGDTEQWRAAVDRVHLIHEQV